ncbi:MAG: UDP-N-acetylmuramoyl-L-alanyl-D-glutamate--2,6-diaminopimelate ligase [Desulfuromonadales bacterium C00003068]|nr:MAG: UDP-N-acetylmuramoyl-L-alanyl-D-glutamate--2,6-diaminopimelate ligase [Desulfuromonadales bacterium C00003068]
MKLHQIIVDVCCLNDLHDTTQEIDALYYDSRCVRQGGLFFALSGDVVDGHDYIGAAINNGALAVVAQREVSLPETVQLIVVADARQSMAKMAAAFYGYPARELLTVGITGTNGKTTMTYLIESLLVQAGYKPAVVGTISNRFEGYDVEACHTTPESLDLQCMLADFRQRGADALVLEVSSHALMQSRACGLEFKATVFTNLTPEHLDYHKTMDSYFAAKSLMFTDPSVAGNSRAVVNADDPYGAKLLTLVDGAISVGLQNYAAVRVDKFSQSLAGIEAQLHTPYGDVQLHSALIGRFNMENLACAVGVGVALELPITTIEQGLDRAHTVPGRLERVDNELNALILVDYAHTGDALEKALQAVSALKPQRIITVFGCGGDRDTSKRPVMASVAARYSTLSIVTSDNPRTEDPQSILAEVCCGFDECCLRYDQGDLQSLLAQPPVFNTADCHYCVIEDRAQAIETAIALLQADDLLLIAGKGHEDYQILGTEKIHFDDREQVKIALAARQQRDQSGN